MTNVYSFGSVNCFSSPRGAGKCSKFQLNSKICNSYQPSLIILLIIYTVCYNGNENMSFCFKGHCDRTISVNCSMQYNRCPIVYRISLFVQQVAFAGLTGTVKFDKYGLRKDYSLDVLEVSTNRGMAKVSESNYTHRQSTSLGQFSMLAVDLH